MWANQGFSNYSNNAMGGGFNSPGGFGSQSASQERQISKLPRAQSHLPCTIAQLYNAKSIDDNFYTADTPFLQVTIVGMVQSVTATATRLDYVLDDMTGPPIDVKLWVDNDESVPENERTTIIRERTYVRVCGSIRSFGGKRSVAAFKVTPINDMNELTSHMLEVIHAHLSLSRTSNQMDLQKSETPMNGGFRGISDIGTHGFSDIQKQVHNIIQRDMSDNGANIRALQTQIKGYSLSQIRDALDYLSGEGHIYSTIDDDHFKATDA